MNSQRVALIVAGGKGQRMNSEIPKQFLLLNGEPVLMHTLKQFYTYDHSIFLLLVLPEDQIDYWFDLCRKYDFSLTHSVVAGGETRFESVKNGLEKVDGDALIAVHDGVRPLVSLDTIDRCFRTAAGEGTAIPVVESVDSLRQLSVNKSFSVDRSAFRLVQTPQVFDAEILRQAYQQSFSPLFTDDASVVEALGREVTLVEGNRENIKITTPYDLIIAEAILNALG